MYNSYQNPYLTASHGTNGAKYLSSLGTNTVNSTPNLGTINPSNTEAIYE